MHNFPFLLTRSCMSEAWLSALVNQGFLQQQDPIRPRWRPKGQLWGRARRIQAPCWTPEKRPRSGESAEGGTQRWGRPLWRCSHVITFSTNLNSTSYINLNTSLCWTHTHFFQQLVLQTHQHVPTALFRCLFTGVSEGGVSGGCWWKVAQAHGMRSSLHICRKDETGLPILQWWCQPAYMTVCGWGAKFLCFPFVFSFHFFLAPLFTVFSVPCDFITNSLLFLVIILSVHRKSIAVCVIPCGSHGTLLTVLSYGGAGNF